SALVHPASFYVGIRPPRDYFVDAPGSVKVELFALAPSGKRVAGKRIRAELVRRRWTLVRQQTGAGLHAETKAVDNVVASCDVTSAGGGVPCELKVAEAGYHLIRARAKD